MATYADECAGWSGITEHKAPFVSSTQLRSHAAAASSSVERDGSNKHFHADHAAATRSSRRGHQRRRRGVGGVGGGSAHITAAALGVEVADGRQNS